MWTVAKFYVVRAKDQLPLVQMLLDPFSFALIGFYWKDDVTMNIVLKVVLGFILLCILILAVSWANHRVRMANEGELASTSGLVQLVNVNDHKLNVYSRGGGSTTLVFMAGSGTSAPTLDFKPLWANLVDDYRIVVIEKAGYGFSEVVKGLPRDIDSILLETRQALRKAGHTPPFILVAHSMSALEAIHWANSYPDEIQAIVGIDPAIPQAYEYIPIPPIFVLRALSALGNMGITRWIPAVVNSPVMESGYLSEEEKQIYASVVHRRTLTANMLEEVRLAVNNAQTVQKGGLPEETPLLFFISDGKEVGVDGWRELLTAYAERLENAQYQFLDTGHYMHHHEPLMIVEQMKIFIDSL